MAILQRVYSKTKVIDIMREPLCPLWLLRLEVLIVYRIWGDRRRP
jgi:hypothetical protein